MAYKLTNSKLISKVYDIEFGLHEYTFECPCMEGKFSRETPLALKEKFNCWCGAKHMYLVTKEKNNAE